MRDQEPEMITLGIVQTDDVGLDLTRQPGRRHEPDGGFEDGRRLDWLQLVEPGLKVVLRQLDRRVPALYRPPCDFVEGLLASGRVLYEQRRPRQRELEEVVWVEDLHPQGVEANRLEHVPSVSELLLVVLVDYVLELVRDPHQPPLRVVDLDRVVRIGQHRDDFLEARVELLARACVLDRPQGAAPLRRSAGRGHRRECRSWRTRPGRRRVLRVRRSA